PRPCPTQVPLTPTAMSPPPPPDRNPAPADGSPPPAAKHGKLRGRLILAVTSLSLLGGLAWGGAVLYGRERQARRAQAAAQAWDRVRGHAARQDLKGVRAALDAIAALTPDDPNLARWRDGLATGRSD